MRVKYFPNGYTPTAGEESFGQVDSYGNLKVVTGPRGVVIPASSATYRAIGLGYAAYATPTDMFQLVGSATKTVAVTKIFLAPVATAAAIGNLYFVKRTAANTGGTKAAQTVTKLDSSSADATAVPNLYSVIPAGLGAGGNVEIVGINIAASTATPARNGLAAGSQYGVSDNSLSIATPIILRGVAESLTMNWNGAAIPAGFSTAWGVEWVEY